MFWFFWWIAIISLIVVGCSAMLSFVFGPAAFHVTMWALVALMISIIGAGIFTDA